MEQILLSGFAAGYDYTRGAASPAGAADRQPGHLDRPTAAVAMAWLFLVAQYESWTLPASVMLSVLFALGGSLLWLWIAGYANVCMCR